MKMLQKIAFLFIILIYITSALHAQNELCSLTSGLGNVTDRVKVIGNIPLETGMNGKARNIWDLQLFGQDVFIGFGNTTTNSGPIDLTSYNLGTRSFKFHGKNKNEAIEKFRIHNSELYIPASDPVAGDILKYSLNKNGIFEDRSFNPKLAHVRDIAFFENKRFLFGNSRCPIEKTSECNGLILEDISSGVIQTGVLSPLLEMAEPLNNSRWNWFFGYLIWNGTLILPNAMFTESYNPNLAIEDNLFFTYKNGGMSWSAYEPVSQRLKHEYFYPVNTDPNQQNPTGQKISLRPVSQIEFQGKLLYTLRSYSIFDDYYLKEYNNSRGFILKENLLEDASFVNLPSHEAVGEDLLIIENEVYVLANRRNAADEHTVFIYKSNAPSTDSESWEEVLFFESSNMARSFEFDGTYFYLGLGYNEGDSLAHSGNLLQISACNTEHCPQLGAPCDDLNPCTIQDQHNGFCDCIGIYNDLDANGICDYYETCNTDDLIVPSVPNDLVFYGADDINVEAFVPPYSDVFISASTSLTLLPTFEVSFLSVLNLQINPCE